MARISNRIQFGWAESIHGSAYASLAYGTFTKYLGGYRDGEPENT
jgi:hypothetical protein